jgi:hypothetical protein
MIKIKEVTVSLNEVIDLDLEGFLDLLEELFFADLGEEERYKYVLSDIAYVPPRVNEYGMLVLEVSGEVIEL